MDDSAHAGAERRADCESRSGGEHRMDAALFDQGRGEDGSESGDSADGEIDAAAKNNERQSDGGDAESGIVGEEVDQTAKGKEPLVQKTGRDVEHREHCGRGELRQTELDGVGQ